MYRKLLFMALLTLCASFYQVQEAAASTPPAQVTIGEWQVTVLNDVAREGDASILLGVSEDEVKKYAPSGKYPSAVNAFLMQNARHTILVDAGLGLHLLENLKVKNITPEQIDTVLLTHMHFDHFAGLLKDGKALFPHAKVYVSVKERDYWLAEPDYTQLPEEKRQKVKEGFAKSQQLLEVYKDQLVFFTPNQLGSVTEELVPGVKAIAAYGHTPGHTMFLAESDGKKLLFWGDLTHASAIQYARPEVAVVYDVDPKEAVRTRAAVFAFVADNAIPVAGAHVPLPGLGQLKTDAEKTGGYTFKPLP